MQRIIFHVDVNSAFLSWEAVYRLYHLGGKLDLRTVPSVVGCDEAFMDMTGYCARTPEKTAHELKDIVRKELGFTVNIRVASNKLLAKMASDFRKPDMVHTL